VPGQPLQQINQASQGAQTTPTLVKLGTTLPATNAVPIATGTPIPVPGQVPAQQLQNKTSAFANLTAGPAAQSTSKAGAAPVLPTAKVGASLTPTPPPLGNISLLNANAAPSTGLELAFRPEGATESNFSGQTNTIARTAGADVSQLSNTSTSATSSRIGAEAATQFSARLAAKAANGSSKFELRLDPPQLGRIEVKLEVSSDNRVQAIIITQNPEILQDLQRAADSLRRALISEGFDLNANDLDFQLEQQDRSSDGQPYGPTSPDDERGLEQVLETALQDTSTEIDTGYGYVLVPDIRFDISA